jgi:hypothetical protein
MAGGIADEFFQAEFLVELLAQLPVFRFDPARVKRAGQDHVEFLEVERLGDVIVGAPFHRLHGHFLRAVGGHQDGRRADGRSIGRG